VPLLLIVQRNKELIDTAKFARHPGFYGCMLVLALTNLEVLKLIPWRDAKYDGFPTSRLLALTFFTTFAEDIPQVMIPLTLWVIAHPHFSPHSGVPPPLWCRRCCSSRTSSSTSPSPT